MRTLSNPGSLFPHCCLNTCLEQLTGVQVVQTQMKLETVRELWAQVFAAGLGPLVRCVGAGQGYFKLC